MRIRHIVNENYRRIVPACGMSKIKMSDEYNRQSSEKALISLMMFGDEYKETAASYWNVLIQELEALNKFRGE